MRSFSRQSLRPLIALILLGFTGTLEASNVYWAPPQCNNYFFPHKSNFLDDDYNWGGQNHYGSTVNWFFGPQKAACQNCAYILYSPYTYPQKLASMNFYNTNCPFYISIKPLGTPPGTMKMYTGFSSCKSVGTCSTQTNTIHVYGSQTYLQFQNNADSNKSSASIIQFNIDNSGEVKFVGNSGYSPAGGFGHFNLKDNSAKLVLSAGNSKVRIGELAGVAGSTVSLAGGATLYFGAHGFGATFGGVISGGSSTSNIVKEGSTTATFTGANTFQGGTTIKGGTLALSGSGSLYNQGTVNVESPGTFDLTALTGSFQIGSLSDGGVTGGTVKLSTAIGANLTSFLTGNSTFSGSIVGSTQFTLTAAATTDTLTLSGSSPNFFGAVVITGAVLKAGAANVISASTSMTMNANSKFDLNGNNNAIGTLTSGVTSSSITLGAGQLTINQTANTIFDGGITDGGSGGTVLYQGSSAATTLTLAGINSFTGTSGLTVGSGTVLLTGATNSFNVTVNNTGTFSYSGVGNISTGTATSGNFTVNTGGTFDITATTVSPVTIGNLTGGGTVKIGTETLIVNPVSLCNFGGAITGTTGSLQKSGSQTLTLSGTGSNYAGTTTINAGTLAAGGNGVFSSTSPVSISNTGTLSNPSNYINTIAGLNSTFSGAKVDLGAGSSVLTISGSTYTSNYAGIITGTGALTINMGQLLTLSGTSNDYSGTTTIDSATLTAGTNNTFSPNSPVTINNNGILDNAAKTNTIAGLSSSSTNAVVKIGTGSGLLTIDGTGSSSYAGLISGTGTASLTLDGGIALTVSGTMTYPGATSITGGSSLIAGASGSLPTQSAITLSGGSTLSNPGNFSNTIISLATTDTNSILNLGNSNSSLTLNSGSATDLYGIIQGTGTLNLDGGYALTLYGTSNNGFTGPTTITNGSLIAGGSNTLPSKSAITISNSSILSNPNGYTNTVSGLNSTSTSAQVLFSGNSTLTVQAAGTASYAGTISGAGTLKISGTGTQSLLNTGNSYSGGTTLAGGTLQIAGDGSLGQPNTTAVTVIANSTLQAAPSSSITSIRPIHLSAGTLTVDTNNTNMSWGGVIDSGGALTKIGAGTLFLTGTNTYSGGTTVSAGNLQGDTTGLQGNIVDNATVTFDIPSGPSQTFNGVISGSGTVNKINSGTLVFNTNQSGFAGTTNVNAGTLNLNNILGGNVNVNNGGTLSGNGTVENNLTIFSGGTITPGNSIGTINVGGNYVQQNGATYIWEALASGPTDVINAAGRATLAGTLQIMFTGSPLINAKYPILFATQGVSGTFTTVLNLPSINNPYLASTIIYTFDEVYYTTHTIFSQLPCNGNALAVAQQIDGVQNPTPELIALIGELATLTPTEVCAALTTMSGTQYTYLVQMARYSNERFKNGIYNAVRNTLLPCWRPVCCERVETWMQVNTGKFKTNGNSNAAGMNGNNWDASIGAHFPVTSQFLVGLACNYERDYLTFDQGGRTTRQTGQVAGYAIGRSDSSYILAEVIYGTTSGRYRRPIDFGTFTATAKSTPKSSQALFYGEAGYDLPFCCPIDFVVQPFVGLEYGHYTQKKIKESGGSALDLTINKSTPISFDTLLGVHLNTAVDSLQFGVDLAWQYRFTNPTEKTKNTLEGFGSQFPVIGCKFGRNGARGNLRASYDISKTFNVYADLAGEAWDKWTSYSLDCGINGRW